jgi:CXXX repeat peptide maturase
VFEKTVWAGTEAPFATLVVTKANLKSVSKFVKDLFEFCGTRRLSIVTRGVESFDEEDFEIYEEQLGRVLDFVVSSGGELDVNLFDKDSLYEDLDVSCAKGCGCGTTSFAVAPNGKLYVCLGFYYQDEELSVGDLDKGFDFSYAAQFEDDYSDECGRCKNSKCHRCVYLNKMLTNEYSVPAGVQCRIGALESRLHRDFVARVRENSAERVRRLWA